MTDARIPMTVPDGAEPQESAKSPAPRRRPESRRPRARTLIAVAAPVTFFTWWWLSARSSPSHELPEPMIVLRRTVDLLVGAEAVHTWTSMGRILVAVLLALALGSSLVFAARLVPATETLVGKQILPLLNAIPALGWAILGVIWFGVGNFAVIFVVTLILIPFCMVNMWEGMRSMDPGLLEMGHSFTRSRARVLFRIQMPLLVPYVLAAVRLSFSVGWKVALIAEFFGARSGLGLVMNRARQSFDTPTVFATIVVVAIVVIAIERLVFDPLAQMFARRSGTVVEKG